MSNNDTDYSVEGEILFYIRSLQGKVKFLKGIIIVLLVVILFSMLINVYVSMDYLDEVEILYNELKKCKE